MVFFYKMNFYFCALALLFALFSCGGTTFEWDEYRTRKAFVAVVNDSLSLYATARCWTKTDIGIVGNYTEEGCTNIGLDLANFTDSINRQPVTLKSDTTNLDLEYNFEANQIGDSTIVVASKNGKMQLGKWTFGKPLNSFVKSSLQRNNCSVDIALENIFNNDRFTYYLKFHAWKDGKVIVLPKTFGQNDTCHYGLIDFSTGVIDQFSFLEAEQWITECNDIAYIEDEVFCVKVSEGAKTIALIKDNLGIDTLYFDDESVVEYAYFSGKYLIAFISPRFSNSGDLKIFAIDKNSFREVTH